MDYLDYDPDLAAYQLAALADVLEERGDFAFAAAFWVLAAQAEAASEAAWGVVNAFLAEA